MIILEGEIDIFCKHRAIFALVLFFALPVCELEARDVYVRLSGGSSFNIGVTSGYLTMTDAQGRLINLGDSANLTISGGNVNAGSFSFPLPARIRGDGLLKFNGKTYRGAFMLTQKSGLLNVVDVEQYLCGVLPAEVGATWHMQALRAQAITARTYVLRQSMNRASKGYDVVDTDADQVYKGAGVETDKTNQAVASTSGEILTYGKEIAQTYFHSDSGGHTADISDVWGQSVPYLQGVPEVVSYKSPVSSWSAKISAAKIQSAITKITGTDIGPISQIQVSEVDEGGRAVTMTFTGSRGTKTIRASQFRTNVDPRTLKSTMFTPSGGSYSVNNTATPSGLVSMKIGNGKTFGANELSFEEEQGIAKMTAEGIFTTTELIDMLTNPDKKKQYYQAGLTRTKKGSTQASQPSPQKKQRTKYGYAIEKSGNDFVFYGRGWGHGVGMCQWGAMAMAEQGYTAEKILMHYYPGTAIRKFK
ncbi:MAG: SpoIID/LytB domain-containing protein [Synergistaceae bacterium]|nr:SpoIID/LytB domain-containing protein [Synergistaceae bacterium]